MSAPDIDVHRAAELADAGAELLDVREPNEWVSGHVPGARHIPLGELVERVGELPRDRTVVCICRSGNRSGRAADFLAGQGLDAVNMAGGMIAWADAALAMTPPGAD